MKLKDSTRHLLYRVQRHRLKPDGDRFIHGVCGKFCFPSRGFAKSAKKNMLGSGRHNKPGRLDCYYCERCAAWHIGHTDVRVRER